MENIGQLIKDVETKPLSDTMPSIINLAIECRDYCGYCVLTRANSPTSEIQEVNAIQTKEIMRVLMFCGVEKERVPIIINESTEEYLNLKTVSADEVSSHSVKEIETWLTESGELLKTQSNNIIKENYINLAEKVRQVRRMYESIRAYAVSKLTYYDQVLKTVKSNETIKKRDEKQGVVNKDKIFVVHGHDGELREAVARLVEKQGIQPVILHEQANQGDTIIEKFERNSGVGCAICLFTADDLGRAKDIQCENKRARQNVVFEAGYFIGKLGRNKVVFIADQEIEIPSDLQGVVYTNTNDWKFSVLKELKAIGYDIDYNKLDH